MIKKSDNFNHMKMLLLGNAYGNNVKFQNGAASFACKACNENKPDT